MTNITSGSVENLTYNYPAGANNGKIGSMYNAVSGETITYTYDSLNRLATASDCTNVSGCPPGTVQWAEQYTFDPFGNLTTKNVTGGSGPSLSQAVNANNQIVGGSYDNNGNTGTATTNGNTYNLYYDAENRLSSIYYSPFGETLEYYGYDAQNRRTWSWAGAMDTYGNTTSYTLNMYTPGGQKLAAYQIATVFVDNAQTGYQVKPGLNVTLSTSDTYFGSRRLATMDQLGSKVSNSGSSFFPWGEAKGGYNPQDTWNFATYWQDSTTGLDYANNRYYTSIGGRFMTPDPYQASGGPSDPGSWNRYAYTRGDPVNRNDPGGLVDCATCDDGGGGGDGGDGGDDPTGYCPPSIESCAPFPSGGGTGSPGGGGSAGSGSAVTLGQLQGLQNAGIFSGLTIGTTGVDFSFAGAGAVIAAAACAADPFCDLAAVVTGGVVTIYIAYEYLPGFIQAIEDAQAESEECKREWDYAFNKCAALLTQKNPPRGMTGGHTNLYECAKGFVTQKCGGNLIDWGKKADTHR